MKRWQQWIRLGLIAAASFVLLVTVLPEVATGIGLRSLGARLSATSSCSSGSSGSSSSGSSSQCGPGTLTGTVTVTGAPSGFSPAFLGAGACPASTTPGLACANPLYALAFGGTYSLSLDAGTWEVSGFYENSGFGGVFLSAPQVVTIPAGGTVTRNFAVPYRSPATLTGNIQVTGVPSGITVYSLSVLLCPSFAPYTGGFPSIACVNGNGQQPYLGATSAPYQISGLPPGRWTAYPGYCTQFGCATNANAGKKVNLTAGGTRRVNLATPFLVPSEGQLTATVTVTGAPTGFADPLEVSACQLGGGGLCETFIAFGGNSVSFILPNGQWTVQGLYLVPPFDNAVTGPSHVVSITGGHTTTVDLVVPYQVLGGVTGTIVVTGTPGVPITSYTVLACPASSAGRSSPECINEYSGPGGLGFTNVVTRRANGAARSAAAPATTPFNVYQLSTLTPGQWTLYPGYGTVFGSYTDPVGTTVTITAGKTLTRQLTVPYQTPSVGVVSGTVIAIGVPPNFSSGVQACTTPPTGTSCPGEQFAFPNPGGTYTLRLAPGTWWVSGFVDVFSAPGQNEVTSPPQKITVTAGSQTKADFTVTAASS